MCMSTLSRRLQILIDEGRYQRLVAQARRTNLSVGAVVRQAIDALLPSDAEQREQAARILLQAPQIDVPDPIELKRELEEIRDRHL